MEIQISSHRHVYDLVTGKKLPTVAAKHTVRLDPDVAAGISEFVKALTGDQFDELGKAVSKRRAEESHEQIGQYRKKMFEARDPDLIKGYRAKIADLEKKLEV
jgi:hypothetical protein